MKNKKQILGYALGGAVVIALLWVCFAFRDTIWSVITNPAARADFIENIRASGLKGFAVFIGAQVLQVVVAVLPGEPMELAGGALYGWFGGICACMLGLFIGNVCIYYLVKAFGAKRIDEAVFHKYWFLRDSEHVHIALFLLFFIPGTPKDMLTYLGPFLPISAKSFFLLSLGARIPSIATSTIVGAQFASGDWRIAVGLYAATGAVSLLCILGNKKIFALIKAWHTHRQNKLGK